VDHPSILISPEKTMIVTHSTVTSKSMEVAQILIKDSDRLKRGEYGDCIKLKIKFKSKN